MGRDFSAPPPPPAGRRLRISMQVYDRTKGQFFVVRDKAALITVADTDEQEKLWATVEKTLEAGEWRRSDDRAPRRRRRPADAEAPV